MDSKIEVNKEIIEEIFKIANLDVPENITNEAMQEAIEIEKCCDPLYCAYAMGWIIDHFSLWKNYYIDFRGERIRTHGEYVNKFG